MCSDTCQDLAYTQGDFPTTTSLFCSCDFLNPLKIFANTFSKVVRENRDQYLGGTFEISEGIIM